MDPAWKERLEHWRRFADWEAGRLETRPTDFAGALQWMSNAWDLARRYDPDWNSRAAAEEHWRHLARVRTALASLRTTP